MINICTLFLGDWEATAFGRRLRRSPSYCGLMQCGLLQIAVPHTLVYGPFCA